MKIRIFPAIDPDTSIVVADLPFMPPRLSELLALPAAAGHGEYRSAWIVSNNGRESEIFLFRSIEDRTAFTRLAEIAQSGLKFVQGFETNKLTIASLSGAA